MNRFSEMLVFVRSVEDGSFTAAARNMALTPSAVSKSIKRIEDRLGVLLFRRGHQENALTPEGEMFYRAALDAIAAVEAADAAVSASKAIKDTLRVRCIPIFATAALAQHMPAFCRLHPGLRVEIQLRIDPGNLLDDGMDIAIHVGHLKDASYVARRFTTTRWIICAAPNYIAQHGKPSHPNDLVHHNCINFLPSISASEWPARGGRPIPVQGNIVTNQATMVRELAMTGLGIVRLSEMQIADDLRGGRLIELFPRHQSQADDTIYAVYQSRRHLSPRVRAFLDFLDDTFSEPPPWRRRQR